MGRRKLSPEEKREALKGAQARYYEKNREKRNAQSRQYYHDHKHEYQRVKMTREEASQARYQAAMDRIRQDAAEIARSRGRGVAPADSARGVYISVEDRMRGVTEASGGVAGSAPEEES